jgi:hypothetical protein
MMYDLHEIDSWNDQEWQAWEWESNNPASWVDGLACDSKTDEDTEHEPGDEQGDKSEEAVKRWCFVYRRRGEDAVFRPDFAALISRLSEAISGIEWPLTTTGVRLSYVDRGQWPFNITVAEEELQKQKAQADAEEEQQQQQLETRKQQLMGQQQQMKQPIKKQIKQQQQRARQKYAPPPHQSRGKAEVFRAEGAEVVKAAGGKCVDRGAWVIPGGH